METESKVQSPVIRCSVTRRAVLGGAAGAAALAALYAIGARNMLSGGDEGASGAGVASSDEAKALEREERAHQPPAAPRRLRRHAARSTTTTSRWASKATLDELVNFTSVDDGEAVALANQLPMDADNRARRRSLWWLVRMANTKRPLQEKMTCSGTAC